MADLVLGAEPWFRSALRAAAAAEVLVVEPVVDPAGRTLGIIVLRLDVRRERGGMLAARALAHTPTMSRLLHRSRLPLEAATPAEAWREILAWAPGAPLVGRTLSRTIGAIETSLAGEPAISAELAGRERADLLETVEGMARHGNTRLAALPVRGLWEVAAVAGITAPADPGPVEVAIATARVWAVLASALCHQPRGADAGQPDGSNPARLAVRLGPGSRAPHASLAGADLHGLDLTGADLSGADLTGADLSSCRLVRVNLTGADLSGCRLVQSDLSGADLTGSDLTGADLDHARFVGARLGGVRAGGLSSASVTALAGARRPAVAPRSSSATGNTAVRRPAPVHRATVT